MKRLMMKADDFGMTHEVNLGIVLAATQGLVSQASLMVPCPWFEEAAALARQHRITVGVHLTATCEWACYRWRPITGARSLGRAADGSCYTTIAEARARCDRAELEREFIAQVERVQAVGLEPAYVDVHMGVVDPAVLHAICDRFRLPSLAPRAEFPIASAFNPRFTSDPGEAGSPWRAVSAMPVADKVQAMRTYLEGLGEGTHVNLCHPAIDGDENRSLCPADDPVAPWARDIRVTDLHAVTDPGVLALARSLHITTVSIAALAASP